ncbi:glutamine synthetase family protein [hydrothermal vent metagenome]|uniref:Glutamine synthetase family protein n=1 Tax=hydrothermal vent metagenome TaxID=652676 RepID=A0A3B0U2U2_9ZZZZ
MTNDRFDHWLDKHPEIDNVRAFVCDLNGILRGKRVPVEKIPGIIAGELRMPLSIAGADIWGEDIKNSQLVLETGDSDGVCQFTGRGILPVSWTQKPSAMLPLWLAKEDGTPFDADPRRALAGVLERFKRLGLTPVVAIELEFYLFDSANGAPEPAKPPLSGGRRQADSVLSLDDLDQFESFLNDVYAACKLQAIALDAAVSENGAGQFEINMKHVADPLRAADDAILFKHLVRGIARKHGLGATFMAKPYGNKAGNGLHVHFSLLDANGQNIFDDGTDQGSDIMRHAVAGLLETMAALSLSFAPHINSYRRLTPGSLAPSAIAWGYENRTSAIRIPGGSNEARRIEHRVAGADANPYLVLASVLGGALLGMNKKLDAPKPVSGNAYRLDLEHLPDDWGTAIAAFAQDKGVADIYSRQLIEMFCAAKSQELARFARNVTAMEYDAYLEMV